MKSLEIVNSAEKDLKILIDLIKQNPDYDFSLTARLNNERLIRVCESLINSMSNPIKQDLEVLKIIRKKEVFITELKYAFKNRKNDEEILRFYNFGRGTQFQLTMEELLKLKQWLEGNKNEND